MEVYDLCLAFLGPAVARLRVSDIQELELDLMDKVSDAAFLVSGAGLTLTLASAAASARCRAHTGTFAACWKYLPLENSAAP